MNGGSFPSYNDAVARLREKELDLRAEQFANEYKSERPSIVLVPGGMGSRLLQADRPYDNDQVFPQDTEFREIWLSIASILRREIDQVEMTPNGEDFGRRPMVASGELSSFIKKYDGAHAFFKDKANFIGFGYDWRKSTADEARFFLQYFLMKLRTKVIQRGFENPLPNLTLLAHSQGGLVTKLLLNFLIDSGDRPDDWFRYFISIGTPFYGTFTHIPRYFVGERFANIITEGGSRRIAQVTATLPGPYILLFAPKKVLQPYYGREFGLLRYPLRDEHQTDLELDPYDEGVRLRFPSFMRSIYLDRAATLTVEIDRKLNGLAHKIFHIRSNATKTDTPLEQTWEPGSGDSYVNEGENPIADNGGASDGTVPFWSARLGWIPDEQVFNLVNPDEGGPSHGGLAEHSDVLEIVWQLITEQAPDPGTRQVSAHMKPDREKAQSQLQKALNSQDKAQLSDLSPEVQGGIEDGIAFC